MSLGSAFTAFTVERFRLMISRGSDDWISELRSSMRMPEETENRLLDAFVHSLAKSLQSSRNDLQVTNILNLLDEHATRLIDSTEALFGILASLQALIDYSSKKQAESEGFNYPVTDTIRSQALITYTNLLIQFPDVSVNVRAQFVKALVDMTNRRVLKKKDYVNSQLRGVACECLSEFELMFPGEVSEALRLPSWMTSPSSTTTPPPIIDAIQDENFACFENYMKLLLCCCSSFHTISEKALVKTISLSLDSLEFASAWFRYRIAVGMESLVAKNSDTSSTWNTAVILHHFSRLLNSSDVHQVHAFLVIALPFVHDWSTTTDLPDILIDRLISITLDPHVLSTPVRLVAVAWLNSLVSHPHLGEIVYSERYSVIPKRGEPPQLIESKLSALLHFASSKQRIPKRLLALIPSDTDLSVTFRFMTKILLLFAHLDENDLLGVPSFLTDMIKPSLAIPVVLPSLLHLMSIISNASVFSRFLVHMGTFVSELIQPPNRTLHYYSLLCLLASTRASDPQFVITSLSRLLNEGEMIPIESQWVEGLKILQILRLITITHSINVVPTLQLVIKKFHNIDIRDRAELYCRYVGQLAVDQRLAFIAAESPLSDHTDPDPMVSVTTPALSPRVPVITFKKDLSRRRDKLKIFDNCWAVFKDSGSNLVLPFILEFDQTEEKDDFMDKLFAVEIVFSTCDGFVPFLPVRIPYLEKPATGVPAQGFPYRYEIELVLDTAVPLPGEFSVSLTFTDMSGDSHSIELDPFTVEFEDMFMPVQRNVFDKWRDPFAKLLTIPRNAVEQIISDRLSNFVVPDAGSRLPDIPPFDFELEALLHGDDPAENIRITNVIIFLPPKYHLMLRFVMGPSTTLVWISTDFPDMLVLLDDYFDKWTTRRFTDRLISAYLNFFLRYKPLHPRCSPGSGSSPHAQSGLSAKRSSSLAD